MVISKDLRIKVYANKTKNHRKLFKCYDYVGGDGSDSRDGGCGSGKNA